MRVDVRSIALMALFPAFLFSLPVVAKAEIYFDQCDDLVDNDFDDKIDCEEEVCWSAKNCRSAENQALFPEAPLVVGLGGDAQPFEFDKAAFREGVQPVPDAVALFIGDLDGPGPQRDDLVVSRAAGFSVFQNIIRTGYISIPSSPLPAQALTPAPTPNTTTFAVGDYNNDQRLDVFSAVAGAKIARRGRASPASSRLRLAQANCSSRASAPSTAQQPWS